MSMSMEQKKSMGVREGGKHESMKKRQRAANSSRKQSHKMWGGRFKKALRPEVLRFSTSLPFDKRLYRFDIRASVAHAMMLWRQGILPRKEAEKIIKGLEQILCDIDAGKLAVEGDDEDIHSFVERVLMERVGEVAGKLHTARSRNDQVATDTRLFVKWAITETLDGLLTLQEAIVRQAEANIEIILPGFTHLQHAQPVRLSHHLLAYFWMLARDTERLLNCYERADVSPLGAGALAGTDFPIDPEFTAQMLGFSRTADNSVDAVSDRDFVVEFVFDLSLLMVHLSRLCEELILWSTPEFGFVSLDESLCTGSSIMPQKKNPDTPELIRGKTGRVCGQLMALLTTLKGLPLSYNRDLQEDKEALFDGFDTVKDVLAVLAPMMQTTQFKADRMRVALRGDFSTATDLANYLVRKGIPFREAHRIVGGLVKDLLAQGRGLEEVTCEELRRHSPHFAEDALKALSVEASVEAKGRLAGTSRRSVQQQLSKARTLLRRWRKQVRNRQQTIDNRQ